MKKLTALFICLLAMLLLVSCRQRPVDMGEPLSNCESQGHSYEKVKIEKEPTCTTDGTKISICIRCGDSVTEAIPATGHSEVTEDAVAATCTEDGKTEKKYCSTCGTVTLESQVIPAGHVIDKQIENIGYMSNEDRNGAVFFSCLNCDEQVKFELPPLGDPAYTVETVGDNLKYTCQVEGHTAVLYVSLFSFAERDGFSHYVITGYAGNSTSPTLPTTYNDKPVKEIGESAFAGNTNITSLTIPAGYTAIGVSAFNGCSALKSVTIPEGVYKIENSAFANCTALLSVTIPASTEIIEAYAFSGCTKLTEVKSVPNSKMDEIYAYAFSNCTSLKSFNLGGTMKALGALYGCNALEELTVKSVSVGGVSGVGRLFAEANSSYVDNSIVPASLKTVTITGYVTITDVAFLNCVNIEKIVIENCEAIGGYNRACFEGCTSLVELQIVNTDRIERGALGNCPSLQVIRIDYVGTIGFGAFSGIEPPTTISIKKAGIAEEGAFDGCTAITQESIGSIGEVQGEANTNINGTFAYTDTEMSVSPTFWALLRSVGEQEGMLEDIFRSVYNEIFKKYPDVYPVERINELVDTLASAVKNDRQEDYLETAKQISSLTGENLTISFEDGKMTIPKLDITCQYIEVGGLIYIFDGNKYRLFFTIDSEYNSIFEFHSADGNTWTKHIYERQQ